MKTFLSLYFFFVPLTLLIIFALIFLYSKYKFKFSTKNYSHCVLKYGFENTFLGLGHWWLPDTSGGVRSIIFFLITLFLAWPYYLMTMLSLFSQQYIKLNALSFISSELDLILWFRENFGAPQILKSGILVKTSDFLSYSYKAAFSTKNILVRLNNDSALGSDDLCLLDIVHVFEDKKVSNLFTESNYNRLISHEINNGLQGGEPHLEILSSIQLLKYIFSRINTKLVEDLEGKPELLTFIAFVKSRGDSFAHAYIIFQSTDYLIDFFYDNLLKMHKVEDSLSRLISRNLANYIDIEFSESKYLRAINIPNKLDSVLILRKFT